MREPDRVQLEIRRCRRRARAMEYALIALLFLLIPLAQWASESSGALGFVVGASVVSAIVFCGRAWDRFRDREDRLQELAAKLRQQAG